MVPLFFDITISGVDSTSQTICAFWNGSFLNWWTLTHSWGTTRSKMPRSGTNSVWRIPSVNGTLSTAGPRCVIREVEWIVGKSNRRIRLIWWIIKSTIFGCIKSATHRTVSALTEWRGPFNNWDLSHVLASLFVFIQSSLKYISTV